MANHKSKPDTSCLTQSTHLPSRFEVIQWHGRWNERNLDVPNRRKFCRLDFCSRICAASNCPFHVGLARTQPDFANQDIGELDRVLASDGQFDRLFAGNHFRQFHLPATSFVRFCGGRICSQRYRDRFSSIGPAPDANLHLLLQNHVIAKHRRQSDVCNDGPREQRQNADNKCERNDSEDNILHGVSLEKRWEAGSRENISAQQYKVGHFTRCRNLQQHRRRRVPTDRAVTEIGRPDQAQRVSGDSSTTAGTALRLVQPAFHHIAAMFSQGVTSRVDASRAILQSAQRWWQRLCGDCLKRTKT